MNMIRIYIAVVLFAGGALSFLNPSEASMGAVAVDGTVFERRLTVNKTPLVLKGAALLRYLVFIKAYTGALYLPHGVPGTSALSDVAKHLVLEYRVSIGSQDFADATSRVIKRSVDELTFTTLAPRIKRLNTLYQDVIPGDRYSLTYVPGYGTDLALNGKVLGRIPGPDFASALFAVWLGGNPIDGGFRDTLLGGPP